MKTTVKEIGKIVIGVTIAVLFAVPMASKLVNMFKPAA